MNFKNLTKYFVLIIFLSLSLLGKSFTKLTNEQIKKIIPSDTRFVFDLSGKWQKSYDNQEWETAELPFSESKESRVIYQRTVKIESEMALKYVWSLYFLGADHHVEVYWNEQFIGRFLASMVPLNIRIPDRVILKGTNTIKIAFSTAESASQQIKSQNLFAKKIYTGSAREIFLVGSPHIWVSDVKCSNKFNSDLTTSDINCSINISSGKIDNLNKYQSTIDTNRNYSGSAASFKTEVVLKKKSTGETVATSNPKDLKIESDRTITENFYMNISNFDLWSPDQPNLYELIVKITKNNILIDEIKSNFAFRLFTVNKQNGKSVLLLNNNPFEIKAVSYIDDYNYVNQTLSASRQEDDLNLIKTLGANTIRMKYNPPHPYFANLCDEKGMALFLELPIYDVPASVINTNEIKVYMQNLARQIILNYENHPSVFAYGISDGIIEGTVESSKFFDLLTNLFKNQSDKLLYKIIPFGVDKVDLKNFDFIGLRNIRQKVDMKQIEEEFSRVKSLINEKPLFMSYGATIQPKNHNGYADPLSIEFQAYIISNIYKIVNDLDGCGSIINTFNDYNLNNPILITDNQDIYLATSGLMDRKRRQRLSYSTVQALFNGEKEPLLNAGNYSEKTPFSFILSGFALGIAVILLINRFKRFREYMFRSVLRPYNFYADIRDQRIMSSFQTIFLGAITAFTIGLYLASILYYYRSSFIAQYIFMLGTPLNSLQELLFRIIWMPELSALIIALISFAFAMFVAFIINSFAFMSRARIYYADSLVLSVWSGVPILILLPISIILIRILVLSPITIWLFLVLYLGILIWTIARIFRSSGVVFDVPFSRVCIIGGIFFLLFIVVPLGFYQIKYSLFDYTKYFSEIFLGI